ncbi:MAG: hypothetical protein KGL13_01395 [Gammaproteobacteria bacterium]|nr:hypothetical protein [Gammaproteobacteria bacterium]
MPAPRRTQRTDKLQFFATAAQGLEPVVAEELRGLGAQQVKEARGGATFEGALAVAYQACLWLRAANRVLYPLTRFKCSDAQSLYAGVQRMPWENDLSPDGTLAVDFTGSNAAITNTQYGAQRVKDAVVDRLREKFGRRPSVERQHPDLRIHCHLNRDIASVSLDLSGDSLHLRGYRRAGGTAPLKETLAAGLLLKCGWQKIAAAGGSFADPMCGSGTLVIEAALMAGDAAPGLLREYWGFNGWLKHDRRLWEKLITEARRRQAAGRGRMPVILGYDRDARSILGAQENARAAGVAHGLRFEHRDLTHARLPAGLQPGLMVTNPPYGERMGVMEELGPLYALLGDWLRQQCAGWQAGVIVADAALGKQLGIRARKMNAFHNGPLECRLLQFDIKPEWFMRSSAAAET